MRNTEEALLVRDLERVHACMRSKSRVAIANKEMAR